MKSEVKTGEIQVIGGEAGQDGDAAGGGQAEDGGGAEKVSDLSQTKQTNKQTSTIKTK